MAYEYERYDDRRDPKWALPGDVRDNWNNPTIATFFADVMTPGLSQEEIDMGRSIFEGAFESMLAGMQMPPELEVAGEWAEYWAPGCVEEPDAPELRLHVRLPKGGESIEIYERTLPDIVVMDVTMPEMGGIEASREILARHPDARILVMTQHEERKFIEAILDVNISGCIGKRAAGTEFVAAIKAIERGEFYLHPAIARLVA